MDQLTQTVKDKDNDPMDAIKHLEQKLNQLAITLCPHTEPIGEVLNKCTNKNERNNTQRESQSMAEGNAGSRNKSKTYDYPCCRKLGTRHKA